MPHLEKYNFPRRSTVLLMVLGTLFPVVPAIILFVAIGKPRINNNPWGAKVFGILYLLVGLFFPILMAIGSESGKLGDMLLGSVFLFGPWVVSGIASLIFAGKQSDFLERAGEVVFMVESGVSKVGDLAQKSGLERALVVEVIQDAIRFKVLRDFMLDRSKESVIGSSEIRREYTEEKATTVAWRCEVCGAHCSQEAKPSDPVKCTFCGTLKSS